MTVNRILLLVACVATMLGAGCGNDDVAGPGGSTPAPGTIVFTSNRDGGFGNVYSMNTVGADIRRLTDNREGIPGTAHDFNPSISRDGTRIAFVSERSGMPNIWIMNLDGSNQVSVTGPTTEDLRPVWSPDGTRIGDNCTANGNTDICVINVDGTGMVNLTASEMPHDFFLGDWSPNSNKILFYTEGADPDIYTVTADGSTIEQLFDDPSQDRWPAWSPDGTSIAFTRKIDGSRKIYLMEADGSNPRQITTTSGGIAPSWSPDGSQLLFARNENVGRDIFVMDVDGSNVRNLSRSPSFDTRAQGQGWRQ